MFWGDDSINTANFERFKPLSASLLLMKYSNSILSFIIVLPLAYIINDII